MFPTCPACKQSVLDDDVENCPFCGANMKTGKGGHPNPGQKTAQKPVAKERPSAPYNRPPGGQVRSGQVRPPRAKITTMIRSESMLRRIAERFRFRRGLPRARPCD